MELESRDPARLQRPPSASGVADMAESTDPDGQRSSSGLNLLDRPTLDTNQDLMDRISTKVLVRPCHARRPGAPPLV